MKGYMLDIFKVRRTVANLLLLLFLAYYSNITLFSHHHVVNGVEIVHSHFFSADHTSNNSDGGHTQQEIKLVNAISKFIAEAQDSYIPIGEIVTNLHPHFAVATLSLVTAPLCILPLLRAPPTV